MTADGTFPSPSIKRRPPSSHIYVIGAAGVESVKIGRARDPQMRLIHCQVGCPLLLTLLWTEQTSHAHHLESLLHSRFERYRVRVRGEWFDLGPDPLSLIKVIVREEMIRLKGPGFRLRGST